MHILQNSNNMYTKEIKYKLLKMLPPYYLMVLNKFLDPKNDYAFKKIFGAEKNKDILIHFLNDMISLTDCPIEDVQLLKTFLEPDIAMQKDSILDILCKDEQGRQFIVEMQMSNEGNFEQRALYYTSKVYTSQLGKKETYHKLKNVIFLAITNFKMFPEKAEYKSHHMILDGKTYEQDIKGISFTFVELPKFNKTISELTTSIEKWCYFLKNAEDTDPKDLLEISGSYTIIEKAYEQLQQIAWDVEERACYDKAILNEQVREGMFQQREKKGREEGLVEGLEKGKQEGLAEGKMLEKMNVVRSLLAKNMDIEFIASVVHLPVEVIQKELIR